MESKNNINYYTKRVIEKNQFSYLNVIYKQITVNTFNFLHNIFVLSFTIPISYNLKNILNLIEVIIDMCNFFFQYNC